MAKSTQSQNQGHDQGKPQLERKPLEPEKPKPILLQGRAQHTVNLEPDQSCTVDGPKIEGRERCVWRLKNMGPGEVWVRWDGGDASIDGEDSVVLDKGEIIPSFDARKLSMICSSRISGGAKVSFTVEKIH